MDSRILFFLFILPSSCHHIAEFFFICILSGNASCDPAVKDDLNPVRKTHDLIQLKGNQKNGPVFISLLYQILMNKFNGSYIQAAGRIYSDQKILVIGDLSGNNDLLLIAS